MEVRNVINHFTRFKPNLDRDLHDDHLCAAADRSSHLSNGGRHWWLCGGLYNTPAQNANWVSDVIFPPTRCIIVLSVFAVTAFLTIRSFFLLRKLIRYIKSMSYKIYQTRGRVFPSGYSNTEKWVEKNKAQPSFFNKH